MALLPPGRWFPRLEILIKAYEIVTAQVTLPQLRVVTSILLFKELLSLELVVLD